MIKQQRKLNLCKTKQILLIINFILLTQIFLVMEVLAKENIVEFKDPENTAAALVSDEKIFDDLDLKFKVKPFSINNGIPLSSSVAVAEFNELGLKTIKTHQSEVVDGNTLFSADSMTKMVTAVAVLRMTEEEKYNKFLPDGVNTKLSDLLPFLKEYYPKSTYIQGDLELEPNFKDITITHLAHHTSGLASTFKDSFLDKILQNPGKKLTSDEMTDIKKTDRTGAYGEKIGEYFYNNIDYELLGKIIVAVDSKQKDKTRKFGDIINDLVISMVKEKLGEVQSKDLKFFTSDQMEIIDGETKVIEHPELKIAFGKHYHEKKFMEVPSHSYDMACGGSYTNAESMSKIAFHILHNDLKFSIFKKPDTLDIFNSKQVPQYTKDGVIHPQGRTYGFGYESYSNPDYQRYRSHNGGGYGSNSSAFIDTKENKAAVAMVGFENLTLPLAYALINKDKAKGTIKLSPELYQKSLELSKNYSENHLVEMRNNLEKSYEEFKEKFDLQQFEKPSSSPKMTNVEKIVEDNKGKSNEI